MFEKFYAYDLFIGISLYIAIYNEEIWFFSGVLVPSTDSGVRWLYSY